jgi:hypothetical protein
MKMAIMRFAPALAASWLVAVTSAAGAPKIDRSISKQPTYRTAPKYGLLLFGPEGRDRVWLVRDGDVLYVDRNGNGDLTDPGEKVAAENIPGSLLEGERPYVFNVGDVTVGGRTHKGLRVGFAPLSSLPQGLHVKAGVEKDPKAMAVAIEVEVEVPGMKGGGTGDRLAFVAGPVDSSGILQFGDTPMQAPVVHAGGPLQITFFLERPALRVGRSTELTLVVGSPGVGAGTFAMLAYEGTMPDSARPTAEIHYQPAKQGNPPTSELFELKDRC